VLLGSIRGGWPAARLLGVAETVPFPGQFQHRVLAHRTVPDVAVLQRAAYDHGVGEAQYKSFFSDATEPLFDSFFGLSPRGQALAAAIAAKATLKRWVKRSPRALELATALRRLLAKKEKSGGGAAA